MDRSFADLATSWRDSKTPLISILGASWLLSGGEQIQSLRTLETWSRDIESRVAHLASVQTWRLHRLSAGELEIQRWQRQLDRMPDEIRPGALFVLADAWQRNGKTDDCLLHLMQIPILHPNHYRLSLAALHQSAKILESTGKSDDARRLYAELVREFPGTDLARQTQQALQSEPSR